MKDTWHICTQYKEYVRIVRTCTTDWIQMWTPDDGQKHSCPSGLRGSTQVRMYSYSWVQIPLNAIKVRKMRAEVGFSTVRYDTSISWCAAVHSYWLMYNTYVPYRYVVLWGVLELVRIHMRRNFTHKSLCPHKSFTDNNYLHTNYIRRPT